MKKIVTYMIGALLCLIQAGCYDDSYTGTVYVTDYIDNSIPHEVRFTLGGSNEIASQDESTRSTGAVEDLKGFSGRSFYVYAFSQEDETDFSKSNAQDSLRCLVDASFDDPSSLAGRKVTFDGLTERVDWADSDVPIYYPMGDNEDLVYDFYAYYVDDMELKNEHIHRNPHNIIVDVEIDGSQDLMSSKAVPTDAQLLSITDERERLYQQKHAYSYYTASRNLHPNFEFTHHLVKLDFKLIPGTTPGTTKNVIVNKIEIVSKYKGAFNVADKYDPDSMGLTFYDDKKRLVLKEKDGSDFVPRVLTTYDQKGVTQEGIVEDMGSFLVAPDKSYDLYVFLSEEHEDYSLEPTENYVLVYQGMDMGNPIPFLPGQEYKITMTIFGRMDIKAGAQIGDWGDGGGAEFNPDDEFRPGKQ